MGECQDSWVQYSIGKLKVKGAGKAREPTVALRFATFTVRLLKEPPCCPNAFVHRGYTASRWGWFWGLKKNHTKNQAFFWESVKKLKFTLIIYMEKQNLEV